jgi:hypothetical protein
MKKIIATLIAGLFATAAFAQTPAPVTPAAPAAVKADAKVDAKAEAKTEVKEAKTTTKHVKAKKKHAAKDTTVAAATPAADAPAAK